jgi:hypothetical protein
MSMCSSVRERQLISSGDEEHAMANSEFTDLVAALERVVASSPRLPGGERALVRERELVELLARMRATVPASVVTVYAQRGEIEAIRERGRQQADDILQRAHDEVERLVHDPHLQRDARKRAEAVLRDAREREGSVRDSADAFYAATLHGYHERLRDLDILLERDIAALREAAQALTERTAAVGTSVELPHKRESSLFAPGQPQVEYHEPAPEVQPSPESESGPNTPTPDSPLQ